MMTIATVCVSKPAVRNRRRRNVATHGVAIQTVLIAFQRVHNERNHRSGWGRGQRRRRAIGQNVCTQLVAVAAFSVGIVYVITRIGELFFQTVAKLALHDFSQRMWNFGQPPRLFLPLWRD